MQIRRFQKLDTSAIMTLFYETIHTINLRDYSETQVNAWAPKEMNYEQWEDSLHRHCTYVAEANQQILGFGDLELESGYLNRFYCHKGCQGQGVGKRILAKLIEEAQQHQIPRLHTEASITARPFFEKQGFVLVRQQEKPLRGQIFTNFIMEKNL